MPRQPALAARKPVSIPDSPESWSDPRGGVFLGYHF